MKYWQLENLNLLLKYQPIYAGNVPSCTEMMKLVDLGLAQRCRASEGNKGAEGCDSYTLTKKGAIKAVRTMYIYKIWTWFRKMKWRLQERIRGYIEKDLKTK